MSSPPGTVPPVAGAIGPRPAVVREEGDRVAGDPTAERPEAGADGDGRPASGGPRGWVRALLRVPLFHKILLANALALGMVVGGGTWLAFRLGAAGSGPGPWVVAAGAAVAGILLAAVFNAVVLRLALSPLSALERTAARIQAGASPEPVRVPEQPLADRDLERIIRVFNDMVESMARYRVRLRELAVQALETAEGERRRVAGQLQDDTAQRLASLLIRLRLARRSEDGDERDRLLEELREETAETLEAVRRVARGLHPPELDEIGVDRAVRAFVRGLQTAGGPDTDLDLEPVEDCLGDQERLALYRIVQEAMTNVYEHAGARRASVRIIRRDDRVVAEVTDDGVGFPAEAEDRVAGEGSLGLVGMRERALYAGGDLRIMSRPGAGTRVRVELPCQQGDGESDGRPEG